MFDWIGSALGTVGGWIGSAASTVGDWVGSAVGTVTSIVGKAGSEIGTALGAAIGGPAGASIGRALGGGLESLFSKEEKAARPLTEKEIKAGFEQQLPISFSQEEAAATIAAIRANPDVPAEYKSIIYDVIDERTRLPEEKIPTKKPGCAAKEALGGG